MAKPILIIGISDESYLLPLELAFAEKLYDVVEMEVISDPLFFQKKFSAPCSADVLLIDENFYTPELKKHNIKKIFLLTEEIESETAEESNCEDRQIVKIFKYLNLPILVNSITPLKWSNKKASDLGTQIIAVISAEGGAGCTTVALGISACLRQSLKKTLYLDMESAQSFHCKLQNKNVLSASGCVKMRNPSSGIYMEIKGEIQQEMFQYFPPIPSQRYALGIEEAAYVQLIRAAQASGEFEDIVVDAGNELSESTIAMLGFATKVLIVTKQGRDSAFKLKNLLHNISCSDREKFYFICNRYQEDKTNAFVANEFAGMVKFEEFIPELPEESLLSVRDLAKIEGLQKIAYGLM